MPACQLKLAAVALHPTFCGWLGTIPATSENQYPRQFGCNLPPHDLSGHRPALAPQTSFTLTQMEIGERSASAPSFQQMSQTSVPGTRGGHKAPGPSHYESQRTKTRRTKNRPPRKSGEGVPDTLHRPLTMTIMGEIFVQKMSAITSRQTALFLRALVEWHTS